MACSMPFVCGNEDMVGILLLVLKRCEVGGARDCFLEWNYKC